MKNTERSVRMDKFALKLVAGLYLVSLVVILAYELAKGIWFYILN